MRTKRRGSFVLAGALVLVPATVRAQVVERVSLGLEGAAGTQLLEPQSTEYGFGFSGGARLALRVAGPLAIHAFGAYWSWGSNNPQVPSGVLGAFGGGLRLAPWMGSAGRLVVDLDVGFSITGADDPAARTRQSTGVLLGGGIGWLFPLGRVLSLGPIARVSYLTSLDAESAGDRDRTLFWTFGVSFTLHGPRAAAASSPEEVTEALPQRRELSEDTDGDGVPDATDRCEGQRETRNGFQDDDGCPDSVPDPSDVDRDMLSGDADQCPGEAEDYDGFQDTDGCPEADNDSDGVVDTSDQCADQAETRNGFQDDDGCADENPNPGAMIDGQRIALTQTLVVRGGRVEGSGEALLTAVAQQLASHPEIRRVRVECRSDEGGDDHRNERASTECARAVVRSLRRAGVDKHRLQAQGAGSLHAAAGAPATRVEFVIVDPAGSVATPAPSAVTAPVEATPSGAEGGGHHGGHRRRGGRGRHRRGH